MIRRLVSIGLLVAAIGCGGSTLGTPGTAGTPGGTGGVAGATGIGGTTGTGGTGGGVGGTGGGDVGGTGGGGVGGTGGTLPGCGGAAGIGDSVEVAIVGSDGKLIDTTVQAAVTVTSVDGCWLVGCPESFTGSFPSYLAPHISTAAMRIVLTGASAQQWTLFLYNTSMPAAFVQVGDAFNLTVHASLTDYQFGVVQQTVVLAHGSDLVLFAFASAGVSGVGLPSLSDFQIDVTAGAPYCETVTTSGPPFCGYRKLAADVTVAGQSATVSGGWTARVGWLSFTNGVSSEGFGSSCHMVGSRAMAGFRYNDGTAGSGGSGGTGGTTGMGGAPDAGARGGTGGGGGNCADIPASDPPFNCSPTYAEQSAKFCAQAGRCGSFQATVYIPGPYAITCAYDLEGALAWARRCEDVHAYCGDFCITSAGAPTSVSCGVLPNVCDSGIDAAVD